MLPISVEMVPLMCTLLSVPVLEYGTLTWTAKQVRVFLSIAITIRLRGLKFSFAFILLCLLWTFCVIVLSLLPIEAVPGVKYDGAMSSVPVEVIVPVAVAVVCIAVIVIAVVVIAAAVCVLRRRQTSESTNIHTRLLPLKLHFLPQNQKRRNKTGLNVFINCSLFANKA